MQPRINSLANAARSTRVLLHALPALLALASPVVITSWLPIQTHFAADGRVVLAGEKLSSTQAFFSFSYTACPTQIWGIG
jgi:hypothetical protein